MAIDLQVDARRLRLAILVSAGVLLGALAIAGARAARPAWKRQQSDFVALGAVAKDRELGIAQSAACTGEVDRCETCHLAERRQDLAEKKLAEPFSPHSLPLKGHDARSVGCSDCHGGTPRALEAAVAHAFPGGFAADPMLVQPHIQASCARCHVPGDAPGMERLVHGARLFGELGCGICHPLSGQGRGGWDFGPDLRAGGRRSLVYLETSLTDPAANFPESTMPSFASFASSNKAGFTDLMVFLESLELPRTRACSVRERSAQLARLSCASCHAGPAGKASGRLAHRCLYIKERREQLACAGCHPEAIPAVGASGGTCPVEHEHRGACAACHDDLSGGAP